MGGACEMQGGRHAGEDVRQKPMRSTLRHLPRDLIENLHGDCVHCRKLHCSRVLFTRGRSYHHGCKNFQDSWHFGVCDAVTFKIHSVMTFVCPAAVKPFHSGVSTPLPRKSTLASVRSTEFSRSRAVLHSQKSDGLITATGISFSSCTE